MAKYQILVIYHLGLKESLMCKSLTENLLSETIYLKLDFLFLDRSLWVALLRMGKNRTQTFQNLGLPWHPHPRCWILVHHYQQLALLLKEALASLLMRMVMVLLIGLLESMVMPVNPFITCRCINYGLAKINSENATSTKRAWDHWPGNCCMVDSSRILILPNTHDWI